MNSSLSLELRVHASFLYIFIYYINNLVAFFQASLLYSSNSFDVQEKEGTVRPANVMLENMQSRYTNVEQQALIFVVRET